MTSLDRRDLLRQVLLLAGASFVPTFSFEALAQETGPRLLDQAHFQLLTAVAETMIPKTDTPGAEEVGVPTTFDALLRNWAAPRRRTELISALDAIDKLAKDKEGKHFASLAQA